jgi:hypothetical protein
MSSLKRLFRIKGVFFNQFHAHCNFYIIKKYLLYLKKKKRVKLYLRIWKIFMEKKDAAYTVIQTLVDCLVL